MFDENCVVIAQWDGKEAKRTTVTGKAAARRVAHDLMMHGYAVAFSNALIFAMTDGHAVIPKTREEDENA